VASDETKRQPGRIEYSYPLKGEEERRKSVKGLQQLTVDLLALHNMYKDRWTRTCGNCAPTCKSRVRAGEISPGSGIRQATVRTTERRLP
jgi:hypothetical protein